MDKETMIHILNQHGIDVLYDVISDAINNERELSFHIGYVHGYDDGFMDAND